MAEPIDLGSLSPRLVAGAGRRVHDELAADDGDRQVVATHGFYPPETALTEADPRYYADGLEAARWRRLSPLRGSKRLHQPSKRRAKSRESRGLAGVHIKGEFAKNNEDLRRKASADKGLRNPRCSCFQQ